MKITRKLLRIASHKGACPDLLIWGESVLNKKLTHKNIDPGYLLWFVRYLDLDISARRLDWCASMDPRSALAYTADRLGVGRLDWCAMREPFYALFVKAKITKKRLAWCTERVGLL